MLMSVYESWRSNASEIAILINPIIVSPKLYLCVEVHWWCLEFVALLFRNRVPGITSFNMWSVQVESKHCASSKTSVKSSRKYFVHINWFELFLSPSIIYLSVAKKIYTYKAAAIFSSSNNFIFCYCSPEMALSDWLAF